MTTITGIPAHALLVHAIVVLAPLTALLEILCAFWPAARRRFVWLVLALAAVIVAVLALVVGVSSIVGVVRIGDAGAEAVWGRQS